MTDIENYLKEPRNKFAAHRYTTKDKKFLVIQEIISILEKLSDKELFNIKDQLFSLHEKMLEWISNNEKYFILIKK